MTGMWSSIRQGVKEVNCAHLILSNLMTMSTVGNYITGRLIGGLGARAKSRVRVVVGIRLEEMTPCEVGITLMRGV